MENPYVQFFCGEVVFQHECPFDRSSLTRWRQRLGEDEPAALLQESLSVAHRTGALKPEDLERGAADMSTGAIAAAARPGAAYNHPAPAVEPVIGPLRVMGRNYLKGRDSDRINAVLAAAGDNFSLLLRGSKTAWAP